MESTKCRRGGFDQLGHVHPFNSTAWPLEPFHVLSFKNFPCGQGKFITNSHNHQSEYVSNAEIVSWQHLRKKHLWLMIYALYMVIIRRGQTIHNSTQELHYHFCRFALSLIITFHFLRYWLLRKAVERLDHLHSCHVLLNVSQSQ